MDLENNGAAMDAGQTGAQAQADAAAEAAAETAAEDAAGIGAAEESGAVDAAEPAAETDAPDEASPDEADDAEEADDGAEHFEIIEEDGEPSAEGADAAEDAEAQPPKKKSPVLGICLAFAVALLAVAAIFIAKSVKGGAVIAHENEAGYTSYTMTEEQVNDRILGNSVAKCGKRELTNRQLPFYYWQGYYSFISSYGQYASFLLDSTKGLDEQEYADGITWQQQFLDSAVQMFSSVSSLCQEAEANGFTLGEEEQQYLDSLSESLDSAAVYYGFENGESYLRQAFGSTVTAADYRQFVTENMIASMYLSQLVENASYTDEDIEAYYDENAERFEANRVMKVDSPMVNIRHILIQPAETDENGEYTDEAWAEAEQKINEIYDEWKSGEQTEDSFAALAQEYSADGSAANGGLIENVYPGQMVDNFNDWCFADGRMVGDTGIVKTEFGYHIIYLSAILDEIYWRTTAASDYVNNLSSQLSDDILAKYETKTTLENAALLDVLAAQRVQAEAETQTGE